MALPDFRTTGVMDCLYCTLQREARLKAELQVGALTLALARSIKDRLADPGKAFEDLTGQSLTAYIAARRKPA